MRAEKATVGRTRRARRRGTERVVIKPRGEEEEEEEEKEEEGVEDRLSSL